MKEKPDNKKWIILAVVSLGVFMTCLDASIVNIALPEIVRYFDAPLPTAEWVIMIYLLFISSLLLMYGRIGDMYGHKLVYGYGFAIFIIGSLCCALAVSIGWLIVARALQAIGGGMIMAVVQAIIAATFSPHERGRAIGINAVSVSLGLASGPTIGGLLVGNFGWKSIFTVNIPVGIIGVIMVWLYLPSGSRKSQIFDFPGAIMSFIGLSTFLMALSHGENWGWSSPGILSLLFAAFFAFVAFGYIERKSKAPMMRLELFHNRLFSAANVAAMINYLTQYIIIFLMPFFLINYKHFPSNQAGIVMSAFPLMSAVTAPFSGALSDKIGSRLLTTLGMATIAAAVYLLSNIVVLESPYLTAIGLALVGLGNGLFLSPNNNAIMSSVPKEYAGIGSGMLATMRNVGQVMGIAISGAVFSNRLALHSIRLNGEGWSEQVINQNSFISAIHDTYLVSMLIALIGVAVCLIRGDVRRS